MTTELLEPPAKTTPVESESIERDLVDAVVAVVGTEAAAETCREQLRGAQAVADRMATIDPAKHPGELAGWIRDARAAVTSAQILQARLDYLEALDEAGEDEAAESIGPVPADPDSRDRAVIRLLVREGFPGPTTLRTALASLESSRDQHSAELEKLDRRIEVASESFRTGANNVTQASFEAVLLNEILPRRRELETANQAIRTAVEPIQRHLRANIASVFSDADPIANGIHSRAALADSGRIESDDTLRGLNSEFADVKGQLDALGFGGKVLASLRSDELVARRKELDKLIAARRRELFAALGEPAAGIVSQAAGGHYAAVEQIAAAFQEDPMCFPPGLLDSILELHMNALQQSAQAVLDALSPPIPTKPAGR